MEKVTKRRRLRAERKGAARAPSPPPGRTPGPPIRGSKYEFNLSRTLHIRDALFFTMMKRN